MLIPFDLIAAMLFLGFYIAKPDPAPPAAAYSAAVIAAFAAAFALAGGGLDFLALRHVRTGGRTLAERRLAAASAENLLRVLLVAGYACALELSSFPWAMAERLGLYAGGGSFWIQLLALAPYALYFVCVWLPMYGLHRETFPGKWTRRSFLVHKARYNLVLLVAWIPFAAFSEWVTDALIALPFLVFAAAWTFPYLLVKLWGCKPIADPELLALVDGLEKRAGARFSRVYMWEPGGGRMQNAAAVGILPPFRYLFLTPALVAGLRRDELEAVVLHELGHIKKRHLLFYLVTTLAGINVAAIIGGFLPLDGELERFAITVALLLFYFRFVFGWLSRNMERQADLFSLATTGSAVSLVNALEKLGISAGNVRNARSWHHLGIAERVRFLRLAERDPKPYLMHEEGCRRIAVAGYAFSIAALAFIGYALFETSLHVAHAAPARHREIAHWRRVTQLLPGSAVGRLELAYRLASDPATREEAKRLAAEALRLSSASEERKAAEKLLDELDREGRW
ncbi:MAG: M48 family metalloprotease [Planctomycetota bacterium]|jgi:Zn-dependent protease with chaperone function|nr:M48 family metalloprotease [Planctomycetota bacterium]